MQPPRFGPPRRLQKVANDRQPVAGSQNVQGRIVAEHDRAGKPQQQNAVRLLLERLEQGFPFDRLALGQIA